MTSSIASCRSCNASIRWARTQHGNLMPLDAHPTANGCIDIIDGTAMATTPQAGRLLWMPHHATCPDADTWRRA